MSQVTCSAGPQADDIGCADADLLAQLRAGDEAAMAQLVNQWSPAMFRVARSFVDSPQSAEDAVQDAWLGMLSGLAAFEGRSSLRTWTFTIIPPLEAIQTVDVSTSNFDAELGRASGAVTNVILKSGSNTFHGAAYEFAKNSYFNARKLAALAARSIARMSS